MASKSALLLVAAALGGCTHTVADLPERGVAPVNVPVVTRADYVFDAVASGDRLASGEAARLDNWFRGLGLGYGDTIYVDSAYGGGAASDVARIAGNYGMMVSPGAPDDGRGCPARRAAGGRQPQPRGSAQLPELERPVATQFREPLDVELRLRGERKSGRNGRQP